MAMLQVEQEALATWYLVASVLLSFVPVSLVARRWHLFEPGVQEQTQFQSSNDGGLGNSF
jgi:hypothetical protein